MKYTYFWSGYFSQWYPSEFTIDGIKFCTAEQYMMYRKATLFGDTAIAEQVLATKNPKEQKALGRKVANFDADTWNAAAKDIVFVGNYAKFTQNKHLLLDLLATGDTLFVEASPYDAIWGIGITEDVARKTPPDEWPGTNWLGEVLTKVRNTIQESK